MRDSIKHQISSEQMLEQFYRELKQMLADHGFITVEAKRGHRTISQNNLYWLWMDFAAQWMNRKFAGTSWFDEETQTVVHWIDTDKQGMHKRFKKDFLGFDEPERVGRSLISGQIKSTTDLTKGEMFLYMERIEMFMAQAGCQLPRPEDSQYEQYKEAQLGG